jgi:hypothetical protein
MGANYRVKRPPQVHGAAYPKAQGVDGLLFMGMCRSVQYKEESGLRWPGAESTAGLTPEVL